METILNYLLPAALTGMAGWLFPRVSSWLDTKRKRERALWISLLARDVYRQYLMTGMSTTPAWAQAVEMVMSDFIARTGVDADTARRVLLAQGRGGGELS